MAKDILSSEPSKVNGDNDKSPETPPAGSAPPGNNGAAPDPEPEAKSQQQQQQQLVLYISAEQKLAEARRLARMGPGEWRAYYKEVAAALGMAHADLKGMIQDIIKADRVEAEAKEKSKKRLFEELRTLQPDQHRERIEEWCDEHDENVEAIFYEFRRAAGMDEKPVWPTPVDGGELIKEIGLPIDRYVVMDYATEDTKNPEVYTAEAARVMLPFWSVMTYMYPQLAYYAPIPTPYGPKEATAKSTLMKVMSWMAKMSSAAPEYVVNLTKGIWMQMNTVDVMFVEEGQKVYRNEAVQTLFDASWQYGVRVPRNGKQILVFCQKMMAMLAQSNIPKASWSRHIPFLMMAKVEGEDVAEFSNMDTEEFDDIRRKSARWMGDHQIAVYQRVKNKPEMPKGLHNRYAANWIVMFAIADEIGGEWPEKIRKAAMMLQRDPSENDAWHVRLLRALRRYIRYVNADDATKPVGATDFVEWLLAGEPIKKANASYATVGDSKDKHWVEDKGSEWHAYKATERWQGQKITVKAVSLEMKHWGWTSDHNRHGSGADRMHGYEPEFFAEHFERSIGDPLKFSASEEEPAEVEQEPKKVVRGGKPRKKTTRKPKKPRAKPPRMMRGG